MASKEDLPALLQATVTSSHEFSQLPATAPYLIDLSEEVYEQADLYSGKELGVVATATEYGFELTLTPDREWPRVTVLDRIRRASPGQVTLTKKLIEALSLQGRPFELAAEGDAVIVKVGCRPALGRPIPVPETEEVAISRQADGQLSLAISEAVLGSLPIGDRVWLSVTRYKADTILIIDLEQSNAPQGALEVTPNTPEATRPTHLHLQLPRRLAEALEVAGKTVECARSGSRLLVLLSYE